MSSKLSETQRRLAECEARADSAERELIHLTGRAEEDRHVQLVYNPDTSLT